MTRTGLGELRAEIGCVMQVMQSVGDILSLEEAQVQKIKFKVLLKISKFWIKQCEPIYVHLNLTLLSSF